jgi:ATP-binding protein involved in chromosome partitioning
MRIAIPTAQGFLCMHFGHCETFALIDVDDTKGIINGTTMIEPPPHEPGLLPRWLKEKGANVIIAGGMGMHAQNLFAESGIKVIVGVSGGEPEGVVKNYLAKSLVTGANTCDH